MRFDLIVSNPPYIPEAEYRALEPNVRDYEPRLALHGGEDGLDVYRRLIPAAAARLRPGGVLAVEVGAGQAAAVRALFAAAGAFGPARERADLAGIPRVVFAASRGPQTREADDAQREGARRRPHSRPLGEADRILRLYTRELGRVDAVVKGVRKTTSRWGGRLEPYNVCDLMLYQGRTLLHGHAGPPRGRVPQTARAIARP